MRTHLQEKKQSRNGFVKKAIAKITQMNLSFKLFFLYKMMFALSGIPELDFTILLNLDHEALFSACGINHYVNNICQDDYFWKLKAFADYYPAPAYKNPNETYKDQYIQLAQIQDFRDAIQKGRNDALIYLLENGTKPHIQDLNYASDIGDVSILDTFCRYDHYPDTDGAGTAVENGNLDILIWLAKHGIFPNEDAANVACLKGHLQILDWLSEHNILPNSMGANYAYYYNHTSVIEWLNLIGIYPTRI